MTDFKTDYGLVVGINDYPTYGANGRSLKGAIRDAEEFAKWLRDRDQGGGLPDANVKLIPSTGAPLTPTKDQIDKELETIVKAARQGGGRRLYFYFSGHGHVTGDVRHDVALCLPDWSSDYRNAALSSTRYLDYILKCTPFSEVVMLLDCCRLQQLAAIGLQSKLDCPLPVGIPHKVFLAYATEFLKAAFESGAPRGGPDVVAALAPGEDTAADEVRGHFTKALLAGLRAGAARIQGGVTAKGLKRYLEENVPRVAAQAGHSQNPQIPLDMQDAEADLMLFGAAAPEANVEIAFGPNRAGLIELEGPTTDILFQGDAAAGPWQLRLEKGLYLLREANTGSSLNFRFQPTGEVTRVVF